MVRPFIYALSTGLVFSKLFFDGLGEDSLIISFATIGNSFFFRPVGAALAGHLGDRLGRRAMLIAGCHGRKPSAAARLRP
ncbi:hypothetical protein [Streptomyces bullii]|uniref:Major Facilitator Superfamily protein n=1 Tax=Streptomyces bullii TaxID=349910 RepID=A0ABW0UZJ0_9ACTN